MKAFRFIGRVGTIAESDDTSNHDTYRQVLIGLDGQPKHLSMALALTVPTEILDGMQVGTRICIELHEPVGNEDVVPDITYGPRGVFRACLPEGT